MESEVVRGVSSEALFLVVGAMLDQARGALRTGGLLEKTTSQAVHCHSKVYFVESSSGEP